MAVCITLDWNQRWCDPSTFPHTGKAQEPWSNKISRLADPPGALTVTQRAESGQKSVVQFGLRLH